ncbi:hypothetical protein J3B02_001174 [Coemansia erecta]|nr:hypothetical protein J3B02_001174 [Coemansia erecta]KAJ2888089.1 hypothetical protein FB639_000880 [Coemansia asiatica]
METTMQLKLWKTEENIVFYSSFARNIILHSGSGLRLNRGVLDMSALQLILKELESGHSDWMTMDELEDNYPGGIWWEMMLYLAEMHGQMNSHTIFEVNYKILKAVENIVVPLNNIFYGYVPPQYLFLNGPVHPLSEAIVEYCDYYNPLVKGKRGTKESWNFIDCFMLGMIDAHGERMIEFLMICKDNVYMASGGIRQSEDLVKAMERLSIAS